MRPKDARSVDASDQLSDWPAPSPTYLQLSSEPAAAAHKLNAASEQILSEIRARLTPSLGRGSQASFLDGHCPAALAWAEDHWTTPTRPFEHFARTVVHSAWRRYRHGIGTENLARELSDDHRREAAIADEDGLLTYLNYWRIRLGRLIKAEPGAWHVPGWDTGDLIEELMLRVLSTVRATQAARSAPVEYNTDERWHLNQKPGKEATLVFLLWSKDRLRKEHSFFIATRPFSAQDLSPATMTPEEILIAHERRTFTAADLLKQARLSTIQRRWLEAFSNSINRRGRLNLAAAARHMGRNRSTAKRVFEAIQHELVRAQNVAQQTEQERDDSAYEPEAPPTSSWERMRRNRGPWM